jgi:2-keto-4-pentenoate hydratase
MYEAHGSKVLGRKIGFTNRTIWTQYGVYAPVWGYVFNSIAYDLAAVETLSLEPFSEPRIEPEIIFGLGTVPSVQMNDTSLSSCIDWVGLGFEIVQSIFPGWKFSVADTVGANGVHGLIDWAAPAVCTARVRMVGESSAPHPRSACGNLQHADFIEPCPSSRAKRKTSARI